MPTGPCSTNIGVPVGTGGDGSGSFGTSDSEGSLLTASMPLQSSIAVECGQGVFSIPYFCLLGPFGRREALSVLQEVWVVPGLDLVEAGGSRHQHYHSVRMS